MTPAQLIIHRCAELATISEEPDRLTRTFASPAMKQANQLVGSWMRAAGLPVREDAAFNLIGRWESKNPRAKTFLLGSHLDTVRDAGKYDGPLGVLVALAAVEFLRAQKIQLPFHVEIVGFSDEEGVRYQTTYLGSRAFAGTLTAADLARIEEKQIVHAQRNKNEFIGYAEVHIEQGPVLEEKNLPVGVVSAIAGQSRLHVEFHGVAGHAGTVPMNLRRDALVAAAKFVASVPSVASAQRGLVATVGQLEVSPNASNVIPGKVSLTLDVRHANDSRRLAAVKLLKTCVAQIAQQHQLKCVWIPVQQTAAVPCDKKLTQTFLACVKQNGIAPLTLPSGAGHDAAALSALCPVAMLFVRCKAGVSHHPSESVKRRDVQAAIKVLVDFLLDCSRKVPVR